MSQIERKEEKTWELTKYEQHRTPHNLIEDDTEVAISSERFAKDFMCPICLELFTKTMVTKECIHRFCYDCITKALSAGNKECPTCRKKLPSKRSLRPDTNFDELIAKLFPNRDEEETEEHDLTEKKQTAIGRAIQENMQAQLLNKQKSTVLTRLTQPSTSRNIFEPETSSPHEPKKIKGSKRGKGKALRGKRP